MVVRDLTGIVIIIQGIYSQAFVEFDIDFSASLEQFCGSQNQF